jgi:hypothetical protein
MSTLRVYGGPIIWTPFIVDFSQKKLAQGVIANSAGNSILGLVKREPMDRLTCTESNDTAKAHMTENGEIKHRLLEIKMREGPVGYAA